ncbi:hypothetical protein QBC35DRAFT_454163 [Podospora australis]|uniref:Uncharacterized protein n=1 Tax=Podospora australis TaxID=1536484 RepID=A0AAN6WSA5_9PEZI|nr:hypothetical protein QBC35DRAFT_454163 [Podospora australis]
MDLGRKRVGLLIQSARDFLRSVFVLGQIETHGRIESQNSGSFVPEKSTLSRSWRNIYVVASLVPQRNTGFWITYEMPVPQRDRPGMGFKSPPGTRNSTSSTTVAAPLPMGFVGGHALGPPPSEQIQQYHMRDLPPPPPVKRHSLASVLNKELNAAFAGPDDQALAEGGLSASAVSPDQDSGNDDGPDVVSPQPRANIPELWQLTSRSRSKRKETTTGEGPWEVSPDEITEKGRHRSTVETWSPSPVSERDLAYPLQRHISVSSQEPVTAISKSDSTSTSLISMNTAFRDLEPTTPSDYSSSSLRKESSSSIPKPLRLRRNKKSDSQRVRTPPPEKTPSPGVSLGDKKTPRSAIHDANFGHHGSAQSAQELYHSAAKQLTTESSNMTPPNSPVDLRKNKKSKHASLNQILHGRKFQWPDSEGPEERTSLDTGLGLEAPRMQHYHESPFVANQKQSAKYSHHPSEESVREYLHPTWHARLKRGSGVTSEQDYNLRSRHASAVSTNTFGSVGSGKAESPLLFPQEYSTQHSSWYSIDARSSMGAKSIPISVPESAQSHPADDIVTTTITISPKPSSVTDEPFPSSKWSSSTDSPYSPKRHSSILSRVFKRASAQPSPLSPPLPEDTEAPLGPYNTVLRGTRPLSMTDSQLEYSQDGKRSSSAKLLGMSPETTSSSGRSIGSALARKADSFVELASSTVKFRGTEERRRQKLKSQIIVLGEGGKVLGSREEGPLAVTSHSSSSSPSPAVRHQHGHRQNADSQSPPRPPRRHPLHRPSPLLGMRGGNESQAEKNQEQKVTKALPGDRVISVFGGDYVESPVVQKPDNNSFQGIWMGPGVGSYESGTSTPKITPSPGESSGGQGTPESLPPLLDSSPQLRAVLGPFTPQISRLDAPMRPSRNNSPRPSVDGSHSRTSQRRWQTRDEVRIMEQDGVRPVL